MNNNPLISMLESANQNKTLNKTAETFFLQLQGLKYKEGATWNRFGTDFWKSTVGYSFRLKIQLGDQTVFNADLQIYPKDGFKNYLYPALSINNITEFDVNKMKGYENKLKKCLQIFVKKPLTSVKK
jgi:hypothetical protein